MTTISILQQTPKQSNYDANDGNMMTDLSIGHFKCLLSATQQNNGVKLNGKKKDTIEQNSLKGYSATFLYGKNIISSALKNTFTLYSPNLLYR